MSENLSAVVSVLTKLGVRTIRKSSEGYLSLCPFHHDSRPSFAVNTTTGQFICFAGSCGRCGTFEQLLMLSGLPKDVAIQIRDSLFVSTKQKKPVVHRKDIGMLGMYDFESVYMLNRGFTPLTLKAWSIGHDSDSGHAVIPVFDRDGHFVGITKRAPDGRVPKYAHVHYAKGSVLYGEHKFNQRKIIRVVESPMSVLRAYQHGVDYVVATNGCFITQTQVNLLSDYQSVYLALDNDRDGINATEKIGRILFRRLGIDVFVCEYPIQVKDPDDLGPDITKLFMNATRFTQWRIGRKIKCR